MTSTCFRRSEGAAADVPGAFLITRERICTRTPKLGATAIGGARSHPVQARGCTADHLLRLDAAITELAARIDDVSPDLLMDLAVRAPADSRTWTVSTGWIADGNEQAPAQAREDHGYVVVEADGDGLLRLSGPLAAVARVDRDLQELINRFWNFISGVVEAAETHAQDKT